MNWINMPFEVSFINYFLRYISSLQFNIIPLNHKAEAKPRAVEEVIEIAFSDSRSSASTTPNY